MAKKRGTPRHPVSPADELAAGRAAESRRQARPGFKARLAKAEETEEWRRYVKMFEEIAPDANERTKRPSAAPAVPQGWNHALARYAPSPAPWSGTAEAWLLGSRDWSGAFVMYPKKDGEKWWAPGRPDDYCRRIAREARKAGVPMAATTVKTAYSRRPNRAKPFK